MRKLIRGVSVVTCVAVAGSAAYAQEQGAEGGPRLEEVVVTAQKREQNIQDVPLAVSVVSSVQLENAGVREFADMAKVSPSLQIRGADQPVNASVALRGIGTFAFSIGVEPSVAVQLDDVPVAFQARAFTDMTDVERVEVLRGPQSTLYGKSASAGLINITTRAPTAELTSLIDVQATTDEEYRAALSISGPIGSTLSYRLTGSHSDFAGNIENIATGKTLNGRDDTTFRGKLLWEPSEALAITLGANYSEGTSTAVYALSALSPNARLRGNPALSPDVVMPGITAGPDNLEISHNVEPFAKSDGFGQSLKVAYEFANDITLMSITSHDDFSLDDRLDVDRTSYPDLSNWQGGTFEAKVVTQEFRLVSPASDTLQYTAGLYYGDNDLSRRFSRGPLFSLANWYATSDSTVKAVYGQLDWTFLPATTATLGARYQNEEIAYTFNDIQNAANFAGSSSDDASTFRVGVRHDFTDEFMAFIAFATGHKGQTYDLTTGFNATRAAAGPVNPETSDSYEIGFKSRLFDQRMTLNVTAFDVTYDDFQQQGIETIGGVQNYRLTNVGTVKTQGVEIETDFQATTDLRLNAAVAYVDAMIDEFPGANCYPGQTAAQGCAGTPARQDLGGKRLPSAPEWKVNAGWEYEFGLGSLPFDGTFAGSYVWQSEQNFSLNQDPVTVQDAYGVLNLSVGLKQHSGHYRIVLFVNNVLDEGYAVNAGNQYGNFGNQLATEFLPARDFERYAGARLSLSF
ncbi:iron complex outermembrane receptor protein [Povalibacter uvarum]|uniref:Iron complex outermembrane receptor protein n=1 Tax=Povalibacter uvarum TaxID=732238 RepID=A0A841HPQ3_9GAMM|nr:TonB-dependent receptor [Povalibacter uvarum]MBB6094098.1 iron complex outermembrane receptor protein [Povalibacter uvarum]